MKASWFYRIAAVLLVLFAVGHTMGFRKTDPAWGVDGLLGSLKQMHFSAQGFDRTYLRLLRGIRAVRVDLHGVCGSGGVAIGKSAWGDGGVDADGDMGICHLHGGDYGAELDEFFCGAGDFFWADYGVFA